MRLFGLNSSHVGYLQVCKEGQWTGIAYQDKEGDWTRKNSIVVCQELGFQGALTILNGDGYVLSCQQKCSYIISCLFLAYHGEYFPAKLSCDLNAPAALLGFSYTLNAFLWSTCWDIQTFLGL